MLLCPGTVLDPRDTEMNCLYSWLLKAKKEMSTTIKIRWGRCYKNNIWAQARTCNSSVQEAEAGGL
jgi:hypothetical protein